MPNEFIIRDGFDSKFNVTVTGSLNITGLIETSLLTASYAMTAGYVETALSASVTSFVNSSSYSLFSVSSSFANSTDVNLSYPTDSYTATSISGGISVAAGTAAGGLGYISPILSFSYTTIQQSYSIPIANVLYATPIIAPRDCTPVRIGLTAQTLSTAGGTGSVRLGIYSNSNTMLPETLLTPSNIQLYWNAGTGRYFSETAITDSITLKQNEIYWLAFMAVDNPVGLAYGCMAWSAATPWTNTPQNKFFNPLLGVATPADENSLKQLAYYRYSITNTGSMPSTLTQTIASITPISYGQKSVVSVNHATIPVGPSLYVTY